MNSDSIFQMKVAERRQEIAADRRADRLADLRELRREEARERAKERRQELQREIAREGKSKKPLHHVRAAVLKWMEQNPEADLPWWMHRAKAALEKRG